MASKGLEATNLMQLSLRTVISKHITAWLPLAPTAGLFKLLVAWGPSSSCQKDAGLVNKAIPGPVFQEA